MMSLLKQRSDIIDITVKLRENCIATRIFILFFYAV